MATKNNWLKTNIKERLVDPSVDIKVWHDVLSVRALSWDQAIQETVEDLSKLEKKLYVPLSGGMDSEYVMKTLQHLNPIPIIVVTPGNALEVSYAFHYCKHNNITPVVIEHTEKQLIDIFYEEIYKKLNGVGIYSIAALIASKYAYENDGVAIIGEHAYDGVSEWDFYNDALISEEACIYFFMWTPELIKAMINEYDGSDHQEFKYQLYQIPFRPKITFDHSDQFNEVYTMMMKKRKARPKTVTKVVL